MLDESRTEFMLRWHLYRRWRIPQRRERRAEYDFYKMLDSIPAGTFLDLGANVGKITAKALEYGHDVVAFEPDPLALAELRQRFGSDPRVQIVPKAVGARAGTATFYRGDNDYTEASSLLKNAYNSAGIPIEVEVVNIVDFIRDFQGTIAAIKMDIEGAEAECLEAILDNGLHKNVGHILVETHERFSTELVERIGQLRRRTKGIPNINLDWI